MKTKPIPPDFRDAAPTKTVSELVATYHIGRATVVKYCRALGVSTAGGRRKAYVRRGSRSEAEKIAVCLNCTSPTCERGVCAKIKGA